MNSKNGLITNSVFFRWQKSNLVFQNITLTLAVTVISIFLVSSFSKTDTSWASDITADTVISLANQDRSKQSLPALKTNTKLTQAAEDKAQDMVANNYFAHTSGQGTTPWSWIEKEKYDYNYAGENLAMDFTAAEKMNDAWMASPTHRANILNTKYLEIGVGIATGNINGHITTVVVQMFGSGDKSKDASSNQEENAASNPKDSNKPPALPELPAGTDGKILFNSFRPLVTYPLDGATVSDMKISIMGRSQPNGMVAIYEGNNFLGQTTASDDGWFKLSGNNFGPGSHNLVAKSGAKQKLLLTSQQISFAVDNEKPEIQYELENSAYSSSGAYLLKVVLNKPNCSVRFAGEMTDVKNSGSLVLAAPEKMLSAVIKVEDTAGNTSYKEANFSNYAAGENAGELVNTLAEVLSGGSRVVATGRQAMIENLNLAMANNNY